MTTAAPSVQTPNVQQCLVKLSGPQEIADARTAIQQILRDIGFVVIRGTLDSDDVTREHQQLAARFDPRRDIRRSGPILDRMPNFQRLDCGDYAQVNARLSRMIARLFWNPDDLFSGLSRTLQQVRDLIVDRRIDYDQGRYTLDGHRFFEFPKLLHYPAGGGFLARHHDGYNGDGVFNIGMSVTRFGEHFREGGIYYQFRDGQPCHLDAWLLPGDVYIHDSEAVHGVHAIDPAAPLDLARMTGRVSLILSSERFAA